MAQTFFARTYIVISTIHRNTIHIKGRVYTVGIYNIRIYVVILIFFILAVEIKKKKLVFAHLQNRTFQMVNISRKSGSNQRHTTFHIHR